MVENNDFKRFYSFKRIEVSYSASVFSKGETLARHGLL